MARLTGLKFQTGFWNKSSENQVVDYMERDSARGAIQPGLKKAREHAYLLCFRTSVNFLTEISVLRPGPGNGERGTGNRERESGN